MSTNAIVIGGCGRFPQHLGRVVEVIEEIECDFVPAGRVYRTHPMLMSEGVEIMFQPEHLSILPPEEEVVCEEMLLEPA